MKKARYSDEQIVRILREADWDPVNEVAKQPNKSSVPAEQGQVAGPFRILC